MGALEALQSQLNPKILEVTPKLILRAGMALNGAYALFLDDLFKGATAYAAAYQRSESFSVSQKLYGHWQSRSQVLGPGDEYALVDEFAARLFGELDYEQEGRSCEKFQELYGDVPRVRAAGRVVACARPDS